jgi:hypothetical protein
MKRYALRKLPRKSKTMTRTSKRQESSRTLPNFTKSEEPSLARGGSRASPEDTKWSRPNMTGLVTKLKVLDGSLPQQRRRNNYLASIV